MSTTALKKIVVVVYSRPDPAARNKQGPWKRSQPFHTLLNMWSERGGNEFFLVLDSGGLLLRLRSLSRQRESWDRASEIDVTHVSWLTRSLSFSFTKPIIRRHHTLTHTFTHTLTHAHTVYGFLWYVILRACESGSPFSPKTLFSTCILHRP